MAQRHLSERARKFLREIGSIVLGVLIALGIGEIADSVRHRVDARRAMRAVRSEMAGSGVALEERMITGRCIVRRLEAIRSELAAARQTGKMRPVDVIGRPRFRIVTTDAWNALASNGGALYLDADTVLASVSYATSAGVYLDTQKQEQAGWAKLRVLEGRQQPPDENLMADLETTIEELRMDAQLNNLIARQLWTLQRQLGVKSDWTLFWDMKFNDTVNSVRAGPLCQPL